MDIIRKDRCPDDTPDRNQREIKLFPEVNPHSRRVLNNLPCLMRVLGVLSCSVNPGLKFPRALVRVPGQVPCLAAVILVGLSDSVVDHR
jgi:hypothetical protein